MFVLRRCVWCGDLANEESEAGDPLCLPHAELERRLDDVKPS